MLLQVWEILSARVGKVWLIPALLLLPVGVSVAVHHIASLGPVILIRLWCRPSTANVPCERGLFDLAPARAIFGRPPDAVEVVARARRIRRIIIRRADSLWHRIL